MIYRANLDLLIIFVCIAPQLRTRKAQELRLLSQQSEEEMFREARRKKDFMRRKETPKGRRQVLIYCVSLSPHTENLGSGVRR